MPRHVDVFAMIVGILTVCGISFCVAFVLLLVLAAFDKGDDRERSGRV